MIELFETYKHLKQKMISLKIEVSHSTDVAPLVFRCQMKSATAPGDTLQLFRPFQGLCKAYTITIVLPTFKAMTKDQKI